MNNNKYIEEYKKYLINERNLTNDSVESYISDIKNLNDYLKSKSFVDVSEECMTNYIQSLSKNNLVSKSIARHISALRNFYKYLNRRYNITNNPMDNIDMPKLPKSLPNSLTIDEINNLLDMKLITANDYRNKAILELLYATGIRISELISLEFVNIDIENELLKVMGKGRKERIIPIGEIAMDYLKIYLDKYRHTFVKKDKNNYIFLNYRGNKLTRQGIFKMIKEECLKSGITKDVSPHTLRHTFATHLLNNGADLKIIQELLGHSNISTTQIYTHIAQDELRKDYKEYHPRSHKI